MNTKRLSCALLLVTVLLILKGMEVLGQDEQRPRPCLPEVCVFTGRGVTQEGLFNNEGICITKVHPQVSRLLVECLDSGFEGFVLFGGAPSFNQFIDTRGCNGIRATAFTTAPPYKEKVEGCVVKYWVCIWPKCSEQLRPGPRTEAKALAPPVGRGNCNCPESPTSAGEGREGAPGQARAQRPPMNAMRQMWQDAIESDTLLREQAPAGQSVQARSSRSTEDTLLTRNPPRSENEVHEVLNSLGFRILERRKVAGFPGYWVEIADPARAAKFGFKGYRGSSRRVLCWMEKEGQGYIIWLDWRHVSIRDDSKFPPYVKLFAK